MEQRADLAQDSITGEMAERVVDLLEAVDIEEDQADPRTLITTAS